MPRLNRFDGEGFGVRSFAALPALQPLLARANRCRSPYEVGAAAVDHIRKTFGTNACGVLFADRMGATGEAAIDGMSDNDFGTYETVWRPRDRVFGAVLERQVAVHRLEVWSDESWRADPIYRDFARKIDLYQYMAAPLYSSDGSLLGVINVCRSEHARAFGAADLQLGNAMGGYLSAVIAKLSASSLGDAVYPDVNLSLRESEVVALVTSGLNNLEISHTLGIARETVKQTLRRVYRKLDVRGRAQMVARLSELKKR